MRSFQFSIQILLILVACTAGARELVVIGDSLTCGPFGKYLLQDLSKNGNYTTLYCAVSSAPANWISGRNPAGQSCQTMTSSEPSLKPCAGTGKIVPLARILKANPVAGFIVALGTNSLLNSVAPTSYKQMQNMIKANGNSCDWIGPPHLNPKQARGFPVARLASEEINLNSFYGSLATLVAPGCNLIDSRPATAQGTPGNQTVDGVHRTDSAGLYWVNQIWSQL